MIPAAVPSAVRTSDERAARRAEHRHEQHHRHDGEVLEEQHGHRQAPVRGVDLAAVGEHLEDDRGRGQRDEQAGEERHPGVHAGEQQDAGRQQGGQRDLQPAADEQRAAQLLEAVEAELEADGEQQQQHPDLGGRVDDLAVLHEAQGVRADQHAREQERDDRDEPQAEAEVGDDRAADHERGQLGQVGRRRPGGKREHCLRNIRGRRARVS
jgi:hypothetical protein